MSAPRATSVVLVGDAASPEVGTEREACVPVIPRDDGALCDVGVAQRVSPPAYAYERGIHEHGHVGVPLVDRSASYECRHMLAGKGSLVKKPSSIHILSTRFSTFVRNVTFLWVVYSNT